MPLISTRNPDVIDVANTDVVSSTLKQQASLTLSHAEEDVVSLMTLHSAFQTHSDMPNSATDRSKSNFTSNLNNFFHNMNRQNHSFDHELEGSDEEFSVNSLPIQQSDVQSVEQLWNDKKSPEQIKKTKRMFSTQTYSSRGTHHSSLFKEYNVDDLTEATPPDSVVEREYTSNYFQNSSKAMGTAKLFSSMNPTKNNDVYNQPPRPRSRRGSRVSTSSRRRRSRSSKKTYAADRSVTTTTKDESESVRSHKTENTNHTSLHKELFRLSLELANTLAQLDVANSDAAGYRKQVKELEETVSTLLVENRNLKQKLQKYEHNDDSFESKEIQPKMQSNEFICTKGQESGKEPICITPSQESHDLVIDDRSYFSGQNTSFTDPAVYHRDESQMLFPDLCNESYISCPDLYISRVLDDSNEKDAEVTKTVENQLTTSVELIDPRDEVFDDDPFATFNYSNDSTADEAEVGQCEDDEQSIYSRAVSVANSIQEGKNKLNVTSMTHGSALSHLAKGLPFFKKKATNTLNKSMESQISHMKNMTNVAPSKRDKSFLSQSSNPMNVSRLFRFGKNDDDISVSIQSQESKFFDFQKRNR